MSENDVSAEAAHSSNKPARVILNDTDLENITVSELATRWRQQDHYLNSLEQRLGQLEGETTSLRESDEKHKALYAESQQREKVLVRRLAAKEQEMQDYVCQLADLKSSQGPNNSSLRSTLLDPSVNCLLQLLRQELVTTRSRLEETQNELSAWKFTPDSNTGKRLMAKCRLLYQENEELGKMTSSGRLAKLEGELALQKRISEEFKKSQTELEEYLQDLDEDVEGMQSTILYLQQELRKSNDLVVALQTENGQLRNVRVNGTTGHGENNSVCNNDESINIRTQNSADSSESFENNSKVTSSDKSTNNLCNDNNDTDNGNSNQIKRQFDSDNGREELRTRTNKKVRRSSVLSIDYNDDDALVISTNGDANISDAE